MILATNGRASLMTAEATEHRPARWRWWGSLALIWLTAAGLQQLWLHGHPGYLSWDQADYLNSAVDHGRALGCLAPSHWPGWGGLLNLSPKIPPLASLVNGCALALSGDAPDQARRSLLVWMALLLIVVAQWGRQLAGPRFGLLAAAITGLSPGIWQVMLRFSLDLPLAAATSLTLWLLGRWSHTRTPGPWLTLGSASALAAAILIKQSALLFLAIPVLLAAHSAVRQRQKRGWLLLALLVSLAWISPWLHHNWITTLGGTNRAVFESAAAEGDPAVLSINGLSWYLLRLPGQLGLCIGGIGATGLALWLRRDAGAAWRDPGWRWLLLCTLGGLTLLTLSPNKDARYLAPLLPPLLLLLSRGWWELIQQRHRMLLAIGGLALLELPASLVLQQRTITAPPIAAVLAPLRSTDPAAARTVVVVPDERELNEHTVTTTGRQGGGAIVGRHLSASTEAARRLLLQRADLILLGSSSKGRHRRNSQRLRQALQNEPAFRLTRRVPWDQGRQWLELWQRQGAPAPSFQRDFPALALGAQTGPAGLARLMERVGPEHQLDGHLSYQAAVATQARARLQRSPQDREALWSLAMLAVLRNARLEAAQRFEQLSLLDPGNPWPATYRSVVLLADGRSCPAATAAAAQLRQGGPASVPLRALHDVAAGLCFRPWRLANALSSVPAAVTWAEQSLKPPQP